MERNVSVALRNYLSEKKLDAIILFSKSPSFSYFVLGELESGIIIFTKKENMLFVSPLYAPDMPGFKTIIWKNFKKDFEKVLKKKRIKQVGLDYQNMLFRQKKFLSKYVKAKDASVFLEGLRESKSEEEMRRIRRAVEITDDIFKKIISGFNFKTEEEISKFIKLRALEEGAEMAFEPIVASGKNATIAHHANDSKLQKGFLVLDFGAKYKGYCSDMTRTIYLGKPTEKEIQIYEKVLQTQMSCVEIAQIGMTGGELYDHSVNLLGKDAKYFIHGLGHGFGIEIHEMPNLGLKSKTKLKKGTVFTVEPGYYNKKTGIGIRIEDDVYLGEKKEILTTSPKDLICITKF